MITMRLDLIFMEALFQGSNESCDGIYICRQENLDPNYRLFVTKIDDD
jgi:hypothetical protein